MPENSPKQVLLLNCYSANASNAAFSSRQTEIRRAVEQAQRVLTFAGPEWCLPNARKGYHPCQAMEIREPLCLREAIPVGKKGGFLCRIRQSREIVDANKVQDRRIPTGKAIPVGRMEEALLSPKRRIERFNHHLIKSPFGVICGIISPTLGIAEL